MTPETSKALSALDNAITDVMPSIDSCRKEHTALHDAYQWLHGSLTVSASSHVYIVRRESADSREEIDTFEGTPVGYELATAWAHLIGAQVEEENCIDMDTLEAMMRSYRQDDADDDSEVAP